MNDTEHLLTILSEECSEVQVRLSELQIRISKALRFGLQEIQPEQLRTNEERIVGELNDLIGVVELLQEEQGHLLAFPDRAAIEAKKLKVSKFRELSRSEGALVG